MGKASKLLENVLAARRAGVPLLAIVSHDQPATVETLAKGVNGGPQVAWDCINGLRAINEEGKKALESLPAEMVATSPRPVFFLRAVLNLPPRSMVFAYGTHSQYFNDPNWIQAVQNLREPLKENKRTVLFLGDTFEALPAALQADIVTLEESLPTDEQLSALISDLHEAASMTTPKDTSSMVTAVRGLPALFTAEQVVAMSFRKHGLDMDALWERKRTTINATKGLHISRPTLRYADLAGMDVLMDFLRRYQAGPRPARVVLMWDEIEKMMAGAGGEAAETSGVASDQLNVTLKRMEGLQWAGLILFGVPGSGKTAIVDATAGEFGLEKVEMDFGGFKGRYVGDSEYAIRAGFNVVQSLAGEDVLVMATCNRMKSLPPEFRRRFYLGNWFFPIPTNDEQAPIKKIHEKNYGVSGEWPDTTGWTGAEIRNCARLAQRLRCTLKEAGRFVVPISKADPESLNELMTLADGRFLAVGSEGEWHRPPEGQGPIEMVQKVSAKAKRTIG